MMKPTPEARSRAGRVEEMGAQNDLDLSTPLIVPARAGFPYIPIRP